MAAKLSRWAQKKHEPKHIHRIGDEMLAIADGAT
jgi:hypothetical protein